MKILFVHPGPLLYTNVFLRLEPLGLELVAEAARRAGHSVRLVDLQVESHSDYHRMIAEWRAAFISLFFHHLCPLPHRRSHFSDAKACRRTPFLTMLAGERSTS